MENGRKEEIQRTVVLANRVSAWLRTAAVKETGMGADFADIIFAASNIDHLLAIILELDPTRPEDADLALDHLARIHSDLFDEMTRHIARLKRRWPAMEKRLVSLSRPPRKRKTRGDSA